MAVIMPMTLMRVTGLRSMSSEMLMTMILLVALATATLKAITFWAKLQKPLMRRRTKVPVQPETSDWRESSGLGSSPDGAATHQISVHQKDGEVHQDPGGQHEDDGVEAQDVEQPQVVDVYVAQHLQEGAAEETLTVTPPSPTLAL
ncbi:hypothetical protein EYF80_055809 [Liparis tanakae]|uniref:Uncharacterized protein n=1 Tax=Liparis tanakae TaxID=230148 RepID=A0A4Z2EZS9_9TELE|nr:hypothetical protein EYF80_055809 [Liparis tanakae]